MNEKATCFFLGAGTIALLSFLLFSSLLRLYSTKTAFAFIWFSPIVYFHHGLLRNAFGLEYSFIGMGVYLLDNYRKYANASLVKKMAVLMAMFLVFTTAVWVADPAIFTIFIVFSICEPGFDKSHTAR